MRAILIPLLMAALTAEASNPEKMTVVVRTMDRVILDFACADPSGSIGPNELFRSQITSVGALTWRVVGGTAPYTVLKDETGGAYGGCITVQDATGQVASGCGVIEVVHKVRRVNCHLFDQQQLDHNGVNVMAPGNEDTCLVDHKCDPSAKVPAHATPTTPTVDPIRPVTSTPSGTPDSPVTRLREVRGPITTPAPRPTGPKTPIKPYTVEKQGHPSSSPRNRPGTGRHHTSQPAVQPARTAPVIHHTVQRTSRPVTSPRPSAGHATYRVAPRSN